MTDSRSAGLRDRLFTRAELPALLDLVAANARARWPAPAYLLNSDVAWRLPGSRGDLRLWFDEEGLAGYAWFGLDEPSTFDQRAGIGLRSPLAELQLRWLESRRRELPPGPAWLLAIESMEQWERALDSGAHVAPGPDRILQVGAFDADDERARLLDAQGFEPTAHSALYMHRSLDEAVPDAGLGAGWRVRAVRGCELEARVGVHRASWHASSYSLGQYTALRSIDAYDPELDLVVESPAGELTSYCIGWVDASLGVGSFEPVGTPVAWRRQGLGRACQYEGLRRMQARGMHSAKIGTAGFNERAFGLYSACGFQLVDRLRTFVKTL